MGEDNIDRRGPITIDDCHIGRRMEIKMAEVLTKIENMEKDQVRQREERNEMKTDIKSILTKFDTLDKKYASKTEIKEARSFSKIINTKVNWAITSFVSGMFVVIMFLIKLVLAS